MFCPILSVSQSTPRACLGDQCQLFIAAGEQWHKGVPSGWCGLSAPNHVKASAFGPFIVAATPTTPAPPGVAAPQPAPAAALPLGDVEALADAARTRALADAIASAAPTAVSTDTPAQPGVTIVLDLADTGGAFPPEALADPDFVGALASLIGVPLGLHHSVDNPEAQNGCVRWRVRDEDAIGPMLFALGRAVPVAQGQPVWVTIHRDGAAVESVDARTAPSA